MTNEVNPNPSPSTGFSLMAVVLHWLLAAALIAMFTVGYYMEDLPVSHERLKLFNWHKWAGICILTLSVWRLVWRLTHRPPPLSADIQRSMPAWQHHAHYLTQYSMYALFFIVPLAGWAYSSAAGYPVVVFGVLPLPDFEASPPYLRPTFFEPPISTRINRSRLGVIVCATSFVCGAGADWLNMRS
jgi:cytochrome b561